MNKKLILISDMHIMISFCYMRNKEQKMRLRALRHTFIEEIISTPEIVSMEIRTQASMHASAYTYQLGYA
jgi:hypothetical protein